MIRFWLSAFVKNRKRARCVGSPYVGYIFMGDGHKVACAEAQYASACIAGDE